MSLIRQNWAIISVPNTVALVLALSGLLSPVGATMISNGSTILAAGNALRPLVELDGRGKPVQPTR
jgi:Cu2+-exporting ATPase